MGLGGNINYPIILKLLGTILSGGIEWGKRRKFRGRKSRLKKGRGEEYHIAGNVIHPCWWVGRARAGEVEHVVGGGEERVPGGLLDPVDIHRAGQLQPRSNLDTVINLLNLILNFKGKCPSL